jgi:hypothetical protein
MTVFRRLSIFTVALMIVLPVTQSMGTAPAFACSCAPVSTSAFNRIGGADAAFVGTPTSRVDQGGRTIWTVDVGHVAHGAVATGDIVEVATPAARGNCDVSLAANKEQGLVVFEGDDGSFGIPHCAPGAGANDIRAYRSEMPAPTGAGSVAAIVSAQWGEATLIALDANDRPLAYGFGRTLHRALAACPDGRSVVTLSLGSNHAAIAEWDVATMTVRRSFDLNGDTSRYDRMSCDASGVIEVGGTKGSARVDARGMVSYDDIPLPAIPTPASLDDGLIVRATQGTDVLASSGRVERALARVKPDGSVTDVLPGAWGLFVQFVSLPNPSVTVSAPVLVPPAKSRVVTPGVTIDDASSGATWVRPVVGAVGATFVGFAMFGGFRRRGRRGPLSRR